MMSMLLSAFDVITYETSEDGACNRRFEPSHTVIHKIAHHIANEVIVGESFRDFGILLRHKSTLVAERYATFGTYSVLVVGTRV